MKLRIDRDALVSALGVARGVAAREADLPILRNVLLAARDEKAVEITATDLNMSIRTTVDALVEAPGSVAVPSKELYAMVRGFGERDVTFEATGGKVFMRCGKSRRTLPAMAAEDYPAVLTDVPLSFLPSETVRGGAVVAALSRALYTTPRERDPFSVAGVYIHRTEDGHHRCVGTDGHRLSYCELPASDLGDLSLEAGGIIVPQKGALEMLKLLDGGGDAWVSLGGKELWLKTESAVLSLRLLAETFPDYPLIIPEERPHVMTFDREEMLQRLNPMMVLATDKWRAVKLSVSPGILLLGVGNADLGSAEDEMDVEYEGEEFSIHFNLRYVLDVLKNSSGSRMRMEWLDNMHGAVFLEEANPHALHLCMPMIV